MIHVIQDWNSREHATILEEMYRLRARVFHDKLQWNVQVRNGLERDRFDDESPVYIIHTNSLGIVDGSCRLLPTTGPTLLSEVFSDTMPDAVHLSAPSIWECTRFCVEHETSPQSYLQVNMDVAGAVVAGIGAVSLKSGVETILGNFDAMMLRVYRRIGCKVQVLGCSHRYGRPIYLGSFPVLPETVASVGERVGGPVRFAFSPMAA